MSTWSLTRASTAILSTPIDNKRIAMMRNPVSSFACTEGVDAGHPVDEGAQDARQRAQIDVRPIGVLSLGARLALGLRGVGLHEGLPWPRTFAGCRHRSIYALGCTPRHPVTPLTCASVLLRGRGGGRRLAFWAAGIVTT